MDSNASVTNASHHRKLVPEATKTSDRIDFGHNKYIFNVKAPKMVVLFAIVALLCLVFHLHSNPLQLVTQYNSFHDISNPLQLVTQYNSFRDIVGENESTTPKKEKAVDLRSILKNAAMDDKTVILTTLNKAWAEPNSMFDLFLESFRIGYRTQRLLNHLVVITLDEHAYARCTEVHSHCYAHKTNGTDFSGEAEYMKPDYLDMVWWRLNFLGSILRLGYNFLFTDTDIMWFRDPFPHFYAGDDFQIACDNFSGNAYDINNLPNSGFKFVKSNNKTIEFYKFWCNGRFPGSKTQDVLNKIKYDPFLSQIGLQIRFLDTAYFGGFCQISKDLNRVCTMHANCCIGLDNKVSDLEIMLNDWRKYISSQMNGAPRNISWTVPQRCRPSANLSSHTQGESVEISNPIPKFVT